MATIEKSRFEWVGSDPENREGIARASITYWQDALNRLKADGFTNIRLMCLVASPQGVEKVNQMHPDVDIYVASVDEGLNDKNYILPGLGDAGDRIFGTK